jgi:hypothetical protein
VVSQIALVDYQTPPRAGHQFSFAYDPRRPLDQCRENIKSSAADLERDAVFLENSLSWSQPKGSERYYTAKGRLNYGRIGIESTLRLRIRGRDMWLLLRLVKLHVRIAVVRSTCEPVLDGSETPEK